MLIRLIALLTLPLALAGVALAGDTCRAPAGGYGGGYSGGYAAPAYTPAHHEAYHEEHEDSIVTLFQLVTVAQPVAVPAVAAAPATPAVAPAPPAPADGPPLITWGGPTASSPAVESAAPRALLSASCARCHGAGKASGGVTIWDAAGTYRPSVPTRKLIEAIVSGAMPPGKSLAAADRDRLVDDLIGAR